MIEFTRNMILEEELFARLRMKYIQDRSHDIHFSDTMHCLTKAYFNKVDPIPVDNNTLGLFAIGFALEEVLLKSPPTIRALEDVIYDAYVPAQEGTDDVNGTNIAEAVHRLLTKPVVEPYEHEGIHFSPDYFVTSMVGEMDLKTTRMWADPDGRPKVVEDRPDGFPPGWLKQFMGYAHRFGPTEDDTCDVPYVDYHVAILYVMSGQLVAFIIRFSWEEIELNMAIHQHRGAILEDQLAQGKPPTPFVYNEPWECGNKKTQCPYFDRCTRTG